MNRSDTDPPEALLLIATHCPHCPPVLDALSHMVKDGVLARLEVINIALQPERAMELGAASAPWMRIGRFEFVGHYREDELRNWADLAASGLGIPAYFSHLMEIRRLDQILAMVRKYPDSLEGLLHLLGNPDTPMAIRIGAGAAMEELQEHNLLSPAVPKLIEFTRSALPQIRADACHYLGLTGDLKAIPALKGLLEDENDEVREIAEESLATLNNHT